MILESCLMGLAIKRQVSVFERCMVLTPVNICMNKAVMHCALVDDRVDMSQPHGNEVGYRASHFADVLPHIVAKERILCNSQQATFMSLGSLLDHFFGPRHSWSKPCQYETFNICKVLPFAGYFLRQ